MIARQKQFPLVGVPKRECKHSIEAIDTVASPLFIGMDNDFRVGLRLKLMPVAKQLFAQFDVIVNLSVKDKLQAAVFIAQRLRSALEVDDAQAAHADTHPWSCEASLPVRATMPNYPGHAIEQFAIDRRTITIKNADDSAHGLAFSPV